MNPRMHGTQASPRRASIGRLTFAAIALSTLVTLDLQAQVTAARMTTSTAYGNFVTIGGRSTIKTLRKGALIPSPGTTISANAGNASAATIIGWRVRSGIVSCDISEQGTASTSTVPITGGTTSSTTAVNPQQGAHELLFEIQAKPGTRGLVEIWASGIAATGSGVKYGVDVGNTGRFDYTVGFSSKSTFSRIELGADVPRTGVLRFRILSSASISLRTGSLTYKTGLSLRFTPGVACDVTPYGKSCGPILRGSATTTGAYRTLEVALSSRSPRTAGLLVLGNQRLALPFGNCWLNTNFLASFAYVTDANGASVRRFPAFPAKMSFALTMQDAIFPGGTSIQTSNGLAVDCR